MNMNANLPITLKFNKKENCSPGFTVVELVVSIAILAVLFGIGVPSFNALVNSSGTNRAAHELISDMNLARIQAVRSGRNVRVDFNAPGPNQYTVTWNNGANSRTVDLSNFRGGVVFEPNPPGGATPPPVASVIFSPRGFAQQNPVGWGNVYLTDQDNVKVLRVETTFAGVVNEMRWSPGTNSWNY
jgi:prepilin-type N-terminal cleavage/methylation domain-containing protein